MSTYWVGIIAFFSIQHYHYQCTRKITCLTTLFFLFSKCYIKLSTIKISCVECYALRVEREMTSRSLRVAPMQLLE